MKSYPTNSQHVANALLADEVGWTGREHGVLATRHNRFEADVAAPDEEEPFTGPSVDERPSLGGREIEVAGEGVGALRRLTEQHPQVALLDDRLAEVRAQELDERCSGHSLPLEPVTRNVATRALRRLLCCLCFSGRMASCMTAI